MFKHVYKYTIIASAFIWLMYLPVPTFVVLRFVEFQTRNLCLYTGRGMGNLGTIAHAPSKGRRLSPNVLEFFRRRSTSLCHRDLKNTWNNFVINSTWHLIAAVSELIIHLWHSLIWYYSIVWFNAFFSPVVYIGYYNYKVVISSILFTDRVYSRMFMIILFKSTFHWNIYNEILSFSEKHIYSNLSYECLIFSPQYVKYFLRHNYGVFFSAICCANV